MSDDNQQSPQASPKAKATNGPLAKIAEQLAALDALYASTSKLISESQKDRRSVERQVVWMMGQPRVHPAVLASGSSLAGGIAAGSRRRRSRNLIAENILSQGRPRGQLLRVIRQIEGQIDAPLKRRLRDGSIRLLKCSWLMDERNLQEHLPRGDGGDGGDGGEGGEGGGLYVIKRRQDLPEESFFEPNEAALLLSRGNRSILALSYGWLTQSHPDPHGTTFSTLLRYMREATPSVADCALFWDYASLPQPDETGYRTKEEQAALRKALEVMSSSYASIKGTAVLQIKDAHENVPANGIYNTTPYERRGWCIMETAASETVEAQLAAASRERRLPSDLRKAMDSRPKVTDISRGRSSASRLIKPPSSTNPEDVLRSAEAALSKSTFSRGEGDQQIVSGLLSNYNAVIQRAVDEPPSSAREYLSGPVDLGLGSRDAQRPVFHPPSAPAGIYARPLKSGGEIFTRPSSAAGRRVGGSPAAHGLLRPRSAGPSTTGDRAPMS